jgi:hypothetical protein
MTTAEPDCEYDAESDMWGSWWLAHDVIGERVKAGAPLPPMFVPRPDREGGDRVRMGDGG